MKQKTFCIKTLGCKVNSYESDFIRTLFLKEGYKEVDAYAEVYIVNTCTVTNNSDNKSKKIINSIKKNNPNSILIVMGCYIQNLKQNEKDLIEADIILGNYDKGKVIQHLNEFLSNNKQVIDLKNSCEYFENMEIEKSHSHSRAFIKIQDGCNNFCSYCIIPYVRGRVRSKEKEKTIEEIKKMIKNNHKEIVLTGIHTGQYGSDLENYSLASLINDMAPLEGLERIRLSSIEVVEFNEEMIKSFKNNNNFVSHLHIPLQSGSDKILKLMNRRYDISYFKNKIDELRKTRKNLSITTDVIVGFPGETDEDFEETYNFCKNISFSKIHVFPYSDRDGTVASKIKDKVSGTVKKERVRKLMELSKKLEQNYFDSNVGLEQEVLIEEYKGGFYYGYTDNYLYLQLKGNYELNSIYKIIIKEDMRVFQE